MTKIWSVSTEVTVAILAQGTSWAVAFTQAFFHRGSIPSHAASFYLRGWLAMRLRRSCGLRLNCLIMFSRSTKLRLSALRRTDLNIYTLGVPGKRTAAGTSHFFSRYRKTMFGIAVETFAELQPYTKVCDMNNWHWGDRDQPRQSLLLGS